MKILDGIDQGTVEWHAARRGMVTGTKLQDVMGSALDRVNLIAEMIAQEATEQSKVIRVSAEMERGSAEEPFAVAAYEQSTGSKVDRVGFCVSDEFDWLGLSPDGFVLEDGKYKRAIEIKNPNSETAVFYRLTNMVGMETLGLGSWSKSTKERPDMAFKPSSKEPFLGIPVEYKWQVVHYFIVNTDLESLDFVAYDARFIDVDEKLYIITVTRDMPGMAAAINEARAELVKFRADWLRWKEIIMPAKF